jgi:hypothetical protein
MKKNAYERVTAVVKSWTLGTTSFKRNLEFGSMPAYKSIKKYGKVGGMLGIKTPFFDPLMAGEFLHHRWQKCG